MKIYKILMLLTAISFAAIYSSCSQKQEKLDCKNLRNVKLKYLDADDTTAYIVISGNRHMEYYNAGKNFIKSEVKQVNDCEINVFFLESNIKDLPFKKGDVLNIVFDKVENGVLHCQTKMGNRIMPQRFKVLPNE
ncbi:hypothetical protein EZ428_05155 [Pedobacter frigiditerrae]|uniref:Lipoprotein n=1 Tax=Pedobacter frigiditerrae TaxID=2530452 RepID=A0A4R0N2U7_9SPHI|nr:hypothetical protein [Pedobacter frigiditerrae]TCC94168.1 hypothetical protein EZ428_05155 [Pedobacter frigiditerrae]